MARIRHVDSTREMERVMDELITQGYKVSTQGELSAMMKKHTWGTAGMHVLVALLTIWWSFGVGNVVYAVYQNRTAEEVQIKADHPGDEERKMSASSSPQRPSTDGSDVDATVGVNGGPEEAPTPGSNTDD